MLAQYSLRRSATGRLVDALYRVANRLDLLSLFVGNVNVELRLEGHHQFDLIEGIRTEIVGDRRFRRHFRFVDAELLDDDLLHFIEGGGHLGSFQSVSLASHEDSAVNDERLSGDISGGIGTKEGHDAADIFWLPRPAESGLLD